MNRNGSLLAWAKLLVLSVISWTWGYLVKALALVGAVPVNLGLASGLFRSEWKVTPWSEGEPVLVPVSPPLWVWGNDELGIDGPYSATSPNLQRWVDKARDWPMWRRILSWNLLRNSVFNLRFSRFGVHADPDRIEWVGNSTDPRRDWLRWRLWLDRQHFGRVLALDLRDGEIEPEVKAPCWCFSRQGWRTGLYYVRRSGRTTRLGFGLYPEPPADRPLEWWQSVELQPYRRP